ncbi:uncharacterized protein GGS25DRAFT_242325 [Hypoxylon fragiforme]|uniref:uncharacterized protein n=1 Tax=Hypoxylon fragiforme TaxID=63214 RepID=UPI0020C67466|nr:uncharacterized protein GGS25DRAFT_242325 [Hypoxylon fragiforme]KAI2610010.1 hypothetical protein GGS25DRAFT_242325 [Hypoxylon fragiforme]
MWVPVPFVPPLLIVPCLSLHHPPVQRAFLSNFFFFRLVNLNTPITNTNITLFLYTFSPLSSLLSQPNQRSTLYFLSLSYSLVHHHSSRSSFTDLPPPFPGLSPPRIVVPPFFGRAPYKIAAPPNHL